LIAVKIIEVEIHNKQPSAYMDTIENEKTWLVSLRCQFSQPYKVPVRLFSLGPFPCPLQ